MRGVQAGVKQVQRQSGGECLQHAEGGVGQRGSELPTADGEERDQGQFGGQTGQVQRLHGVYLPGVRAAT